MTADWMFLTTALVFTVFGYWCGREAALYIDVREITQSVIDQLEDKGFLAKIINEEGEEELVQHPKAQRDLDDQ
jgi:uncharacterized protein YgfB (UPF0149 family)|tara:strand:+ start:292 stop:513 length:222 start_codon:yes stop_codon:yes gene_type:complete